MTNTLNLSPDLALPLSAVTQKLAFLGISGSGKTYAAGKFAESLIGAGAQVVILDNVGNWFGLRLAANGKVSGLAVPILGGDRGDKPLDPQAGKLAAELVAESRSSMILDVSDFTKGELCRFVEQFATKLLALKKKSPSPVMVIWEECQDYVPQRVMGDMARVVGAVEKLIKRGRNYGVGTVLISQRPAAVNKDVLSQIETLFAFRVNGKHDRKALAEWIVAKELDIEELINELPSMETGRCFVWSPEWLGVFKQIRIGKKWTFNASATPEFGEEVKAGKLAPVDLEKFEKAMSAVVETAKANDPEALRARIRELEKEVRERGRAVQVAVNAVKPTIVEKPVLKDKQINGVLAVAEKLEGQAQKLIDEAKELRIALIEASGRSGHYVLPARQVETPRNGTSTSSIRHPESRRRAEQADRALVQTGGSFSGRDVLDGPMRRVLDGRPQRERVASISGPLPGSRTGPEQRILDALLWLECIGVYEPENTAVAFLAGYSSNGGAYNNPRGALRTAGLIEYVGGVVRLTEAGRKLAKVPDIELTAEGIQQAVLKRLPGPERRLLEPLLASYPKGLSNEELAEAAGYAPTGGAYNNPRGRLRTLGLVEYAGGQVRARSILFP